MSEADTSVVDAGSTVAKSAGSGSLAATLTFVVLGVVGGLISGVIVHSLENYIQYPWPEDVPPMEGAGPFPLEQIEAADMVRVASDYRNISLSFAIVAALVAALMGVAKGIVERSPAVMVKSVVVGIVSGAVLGGIGGLAAVFIRQQMATWVPQSALTSQLYTMALQLPAWLAVAVAAALAAGLFSVSGKKHVVPVTGVAIAGVLIAVLLYPTAGSLIFPGEATDMVVPSARDSIGNRLSWAGLHVALMALLVGRQVSASRAPESA
ncbi:MAG: hypothetical protein R3C19_10730 [Planctomycetaceae bacterium]